MYNTAEKPLDELDYSKAIIKYNGEVIWSRPGMITSTCLFDLTHFPYDRQFCELKFGSWSYDGNQLNLLIYDAGFDISNFNEHEEWILSDYYVEKNIEYYNCCTEPYHDLRFHYVLIRKSEYYELNIILPTFATSSLILFTLIVPWSSGERISFATTVMLSIIVFLLILSDNLPKSDQKPLLSRMIIGLTLFSLLGVFFTIFISALSDYNDNLGEKNYEFSNKFIVFLHDKLQKLKLCKRKKKRQITQQNNSNNENTQTLSQITDGLTIRTTTYHEAMNNQNSNNDENQNNNNDENQNSNNDENQNNDVNQNSNNENHIGNKKNEIVKEDCKRMIAYFEHVYIVVFFVAFVLYCIIMFAIIPRY